MKIAVTGSRGFIGHHVVKSIIDAGHDVFLIHRSFANAPEFWRQFPACDVVCHLAAHIPVLMADMHPDTFRECFEGNVLFTTKVLRAAELAGVRRFVNFGSGNAYAMRQDFPDESAPLYPTSRGTPYLASKVAQETVVVGWRGLESCTLRLSSVYGPGLSKGLLPSLVRRMLRGDMIVLENGGAYGADYVSVHDVVAATLAACESHVTGPVNIGSGSRTTIGQVMDLLQGELGPAQVVINHANHPRYCGFPALNINKARAEFNFRPRSLKAGLPEYVAWLRQNGDNDARQDLAHPPDRAADVPAA
jgi:UDP-glucose 4-epimerase